MFILFGHNTRRISLATIQQPEYGKPAFKDTCKQNNRNISENLRLHGTRSTVVTTSIGVVSITKAHEGTFCSGQCRA